MAEFIIWIPQMYACPNLCVDNAGYTIRAYFVWSCNWNRASYLSTSDLAQTPHLKTIHVHWVTYFTNINTIKSQLRLKYVLDVVMFRLQLGIIGYE